MPIYEYRCTACGHQQEFLQKVSDAPVTVCTKCGEPSFSKMVTAAGFQLKGSGWYATDFRNSGAKPAAKTGGTDKSDTKTDAKAGAKSDTKSDTKSDVKSDTKPDKKSESKSESKSEAVGSGAGVRS